MTAADLAARRLVNQRLVRSSLRAPGDVVAWLGAVQAQDFTGAVWGVGQRGRGLAAEAVLEAFDAGEILRTHILRPTWHFVARDDLRWMLALSAPRVHAGNASLYRRLGIEGRTVRKSQDVFGRTLEGGRHLTRAELAAALNRSGLEAHGQRLAYIVMRAELDGILCSGPRRGRQSTYALVAERAPRDSSMTEDEALRTLALRFFSSHGPATLRDFGWWSGLTQAQARRAVAAAGRDLELRTGDDTAYWHARGRSLPAPAPPAVQLLPNYDEYFVAYRDRTVLSAAARERDAGRTRFDEFGHLLAIDGLLAGTWRVSRTSGPWSLTVTPHWRLKPPERAAIVTAAGAFSRFWKVETDLSWT